ncbi:hypothetical protein [Algiphilus aromaticivorans]|uniref:hypothetical protein n=1 Tax=Algiphilus aromaticivorans TaxID=382454 RepID=UPI0005C17BAC|nr:hypothetical protein [Algiphilus aromaticivorans]
MSARLPFFVGLAVALCIALSGLSWSAHLDLPLRGDDNATAAHAHVDGGKVISDCDHCCHASAHLLALAPEWSPAPCVSGSGYGASASSALCRAPPELPFTPPIV